MLDIEGGGGGGSTTKNLRAEGGDKGGSVSDVFHMAVPSVAYGVFLANPPIGGPAHFKLNFKNTDFSYV